MANTITPAMSLVVPTVGSELGPLYATEINSDLSVLDGHDHSPGKGVPVTPDGLSITSDLSLIHNNITNVRTARLDRQTAALSLPTDLNCVYDVNGELYFNDGVGNQVQITNMGSVNAGAGNITNLTPPAAVTYVPSTPSFVFTSDVNIPADLDGGSITLRDITVNSKGITLGAPASLPADYNLTLPSALPSAQKIVTFDNSGNVQANYIVDNSTIEISSNTIQVKDGGITPSKLSAPNKAVSSSSGSFSTASTTFVDVTNLSVTLTTVGRPVEVFVQPDGTSSSSWFGTALASGTDIQLKILRNGTLIAIWNPFIAIAAGGNLAAPFATFKDFNASAGSNVYKLQAKVLSGGGSATVINCVLGALEF